MQIFSGLVYAPAAHYWFGFLGSHFPGTTLSAIASKVFLDQTIFASIFLPALFFYTSFTSTLSVEKACAHVSKSIVDVMLMNWCFWPLVQVVNLGFVPTHFQVLIVNTVAIPWNVYIATKSNKKTHEPDNLIVKQSLYNKDP